MHTCPATRFPTTGTTGPRTSGTTTRFPAARRAPGTTTGPADPIAPGPPLSRTAARPPHRLCGGRAHTDTYMRGLLGRRVVAAGQPAGLRTPTEPSLYPFGPALNTTEEEPPKAELPTISPHRPWLVMG